jgi:hypothetical protein
MLEQETALLQAVEDGRMTADEANEILKQSEPLKLSKSPKGLIQVDGLLYGKKQPAFTKEEWKRIAARIIDIVEAIDKMAA